MAELLPVSSLSHSILIPAWVGGSWARDLNVSRPESPYLAFVVRLHVATALALIVYFWRDWVRITTGLATSIRHRRIDNSDERLAWLLIIGTVPVGVVGLVGEHWFRTTAAKPSPTACFLIAKGVILLLAETLRRRQGSADDDTYIDERVSGPESDRRLARLSTPVAALIGATQILVPHPEFPDLALPPPLA